MFNLFKKPIAGGNSSVKDVVNDALDIPSGNGVNNKITGGMTNPKLQGDNNNPIKECSHLFIRYPPLIGKIKTCIKCGILWAPAGIKAGENTVRISGNHIEMTTATAPANPASGLVRMYATSATSVRMRDSAGTETDLAGSGAVTRVGGNTTEATTTSTSAVDVFTITVTAITAATPFHITGSARKTAGAAVQAGIGLVLNATTIYEAVVGSGLWRGDSGNAADEGCFLAMIPPRVVNYPRGFMGIRGGAYTAAGYPGVQPGLFVFTVENDLPTANITSVVIRGISGNAAVTLGVDEGQVYTYAVS